MLNRTQRKRVRKFRGLGLGRLGAAGLSLAVAMRVVAAICYGVWRVELPVRRQLLVAGKQLHPKTPTADPSRSK